jgi:soluble lytic murein transglycosylase-like protein
LRCHFVQKTVTLIPKGSPLKGASTKPFSRRLKALRTQIVPTLSPFVTRSLALLALGLTLTGEVGAKAADPSSLPAGLELPTAETLALELGHRPKEFKKSVDDFALALNQGSQSEALKRLCVKDQESCRLVKDFQAQASDAKRERMRAGRRGGPVRVTDANVAQVQRMDFQRLVSGLRLENEAGFFSAAERSLKHGPCPRNLSAALAIRAEEHFPNPKARALSKELFEHSRHCLALESIPYERLFLRQGLYAYYDGDFRRARELLLAAKKSTNPTERYRVLYWLGDLAQEKGKKPKENEHWTELMDVYPLSFYSIQAATTLGMDPMEMITQRKVGGVKREMPGDAELNRMIRWLEALYVFKKAGAVAKWAAWIARSNEDALDVDVLHYLSTLKVASGMYRSNISMLFGYFRKNPRALNEEGLKLLYPRPYFSLIQEVSKGRIDSFFVLSLVRQESAFDPRAVSRAKAKGLMQIIPATARRLASQGHRKLMNEKANTQMGVKYLLQLGDKFSGQAELVLAAYNAGPNRVEEWLKRNPDRERNPLLWNDLIPFMETRDYVVSILRNNYLYARLYGTTESAKDMFGSEMVKELLAASTATEKK